ncbi:hypothetical protein SODALDRAFT_344184 [Sodiomyces alkalinus F11]|uniref:Spindle pole body-associated protein cut12 domain-containing protein n=1 Tax=Sodiomyces alkalinus (strain CBS 110278 / VKM F-3762 / F11) TaxID=1314773 RepID=A0A3N2PXE9_SODAK|nr:hypothetical protein SODALDRAFT_344184 [Sodiomyces alkalinus F11]ROT39213.1 hypothetical protein SODALDRAFT_344184 [Sodiomyces alkalinus F11]
MLGWVLRRGLESARGQEAATTGDDTTNIDQPDTPGPVFAARALKSAIFGTPARPDEHAKIEEMVQPIAENDRDDVTRTPSRPQGILLTPGTGASRRKRVSFDHNTLNNGTSAIDKSNGHTDDPSRHPRTLSLRKDNPSTRRTRLTESLEQSRRSKHTSKEVDAPRLNASEEEWEEDEEDGLDDNCTHDVTLDLNEPHSRSGKYWKSEFEQYHQDARTEMEKLLKYKQLAKSYAKMKDAEALDVSVKLKEEQERVIQMEKQITEMAAHMASKRLTGDEGNNSHLMKDLAKQTALAVQYRNQVEELEALLNARRDDDGSDQDTKTRRRRQAASPRTHRTLLETQRELRRARAQIRENGDLRDEVKRLKAGLLAAERRATELETEKRALGEDRVRPTSQSTDMSAQLEEAKADIRRKDNELRALKEELQVHKLEASAREEETKRVLDKATAKIADLKREIKTLKSGSIGVPVALARAHSTIASELPPLRSNAENQTDRKDSNSVALQSGRGSMDLINSLGKKLNENSSRYSRIKSIENAEPMTTKANVAAEEGAAKKPLANALRDRVNLEEPRWKPFIPRSPRNRNDLGPELNEHIEISAGIPSGRTPAPLHRFAIKDTDYIGSQGDEMSHLNLRNLDADVMKAKLNKTLPPERRAAAIARIERRKAEKRRLDASHNKENIDA